jgi:hypothetical protein
MTIRGVDGLGAKITRTKYKNCAAALCERPWTKRIGA